MKNYYAVDIETYEKSDEGLKPIKNTNKYVLGATMNKNYEINYHYTPKEQRDHIFKIMTEKSIKGEKTYFYGHFSEYDFYGIFKDVMQEMITDGRLKIVCTRPMIAIFFEKHYFLDLSSFFYAKLSEVGEMLGTTKKEMPEKVNNTEELKSYLGTDVMIVIRAIETMKKIMKEIGFNPIKYITGPSLSMNCFISYLSKHPKAGWLIKSGKIHRYDENTRFIRQATRGGYNQAFKTGEFEDCYYIDINSAYWKAMKEMKFPDILKEVRLDGETCDDLGLRSILTHTGIIRCQVRVPNNINVGILGVRYNPKGKSMYQQFFPTSGELIKGTWTTEELNFAIKNGYNIMKVEEAVIYRYDLKFNPLGEYIDKLWKLKQKYKENKPMNHFIKLLGNGLYGKFIQRRTNRDYKWIKRENINEWTNKGWTIESAEMGDYTISRKKEDYIPKYSSTILGTLITANARLILIKEMMKIPEEDLLYCDTDGIILKNKENLKKFDIGEELGQFKIEEKGSCKINGEKKYWIGETVKIAGLAKADQTKDVLNEEKEIITDRMIGFRQAIHFGGFNKTGEFEKVTKSFGTESKKDVILPEEIIEEVL